MNTKVCKDCGQTKALTREAWAWGGHFWRTCCKNCWRLRNKAIRAAHPERWTRYRKAAYARERSKPVIPATHRTVYTLTDPRTQEVRYVGCTVAMLGVRLSRHRHESGGARRWAWIQELHALGLSPTIEALERVPVGEWEAAEQFWIGYLRFVGCDLVNEMAGGRPSRRGLRWTDDIKQKIAAAHLALSPEQKARKAAGIAASNKRRAAVP